MAEAGSDIATERPKILTTEAVNASGVVITMGLRRRLPIYPGKRDLDWDVAGLAVKEGWKGRMIAPATMAASACSTINSVRARPQLQGEKHTRGDRVDAAGDGEKPPIQFRTCCLIGL